MKMIHGWIEAEMDGKRGGGTGEMGKKWPERNEGDEDTNWQTDGKADWKMD